MLKLLGIDYGDKRIGLAIAESGSLAAAPFRILENNKNLFIELKNIIKEENIEKFIIGLPLNLKGLETEQTQKVKKFIKQLKQKIELPIEIFDERLTSKIYQKLGKKRIDDLAAMNILESYLTANK